jgi:uncharacterized membrane protein HdeD (DUF308 family)
MADSVGVPPRPHLAEAIRSLWWLPLVRGLFLLVLGGYALFRPGMTVAVLVQVIGIFLIADGVLAILAGMLGDVPSRGWTIVRGVLAILAGIFVFANPVLVAGITAVALLYLVAITSILVGVLEIVAAIRDRNDIEGEGWLILGGVLGVLFGVLLLIAPISFGLLMVRILGVFAIIAGISLTLFAFRLRGLGKQLQDLSRT